MARTFLLGTACSFALVACASREVTPVATPESANSNTTASWVAAGAKVTFRAGPREWTGDSPRSFSSYEILHEVKGMTVSAAFESAQGANYF